MTHHRTQLPKTVLATMAVVLVASLAVGHGVTASDGAGPPIAAPQPQAGDVATTHVIVRVRSDIEPVQLPDGRWSFRERHAPPAQANRQHHHRGPEKLSPATRATADLLQRKSVKRIRPVLRVAPADVALAQHIGLDRYHTVEVPEGSDTRAFADALRQHGAFFESVELDGIGGVADGIPNDPEFGVQYALHNTGQSVQGIAGVPGADINMLAAWNVATGSDDLIIAVLDSGLHEHEDLSGRVVPGYNVFTDSSSTPDGCSSHGTHVSGIIAANINNNVGVAGVTWQSKIMPIRVVNPCSSAESDVAAGIIWATDNGAHIINMSLQYYTGSTVLHDAVQYAYNSGVILIGATGNNQSSGTIAFPARWPEVIAVAATTNTDTKWSGSNSGPQVSVAAPGQNTRSLFTTDNYSYKSGTSFAAPHVSGVAALMLSVDPTLTHDAIQAVLESTAVDLGPPGFDTTFGHGRIDAFAALQEVAGVKADLNDDGYVNGFDLLILLSAWGACSELPDACPPDLNFDRVVDGLDLLMLLAEWG